jgi:hypothetical protein
MYDGRSVPAHRLLVRIDQKAVHAPSVKLGRSEQTGRACSDHKNADGIHHAEPPFEKTRRSCDRSATGASALAGRSLPS